MNVEPSQIDPSIPHKRRGLRRAESWHLLDGRSFSLRTLYSLHTGHSRPTTSTRRHGTNTHNSNTQHVRGLPHVVGRACAAALCLDPCASAAAECRAASLHPYTGDVYDSCTS